MVQVLKTSFKTSFLKKLQFIQQYYSFFIFTQATFFLQFVCFLLFSVLLYCL